MKAIYGIEDGYAYMEFKDKEQTHRLEFKIDHPEYNYETYIYHPQHKRYALTIFSPLGITEVEGISKVTLRKTWKSLVEQGWREMEDV